MLGYMQSAGRSHGCFLDEAKLGEKVLDNPDESEVVCAPFT